MRVELSDGNKEEGLFVSYDTISLTLMQTDLRKDYPMATVSRLDVHRGNAKKGALIGAVVGAVLGTTLALASEEDPDETVDMRVAGGVGIFVSGVIWGAIIGGIDRWVNVYP
jgi:hypothetical protein